MTAHVREATLADAVMLAPRLREADRREMKAASGLDPEAGLPLIFDGHGENYTMLTPEGEPFGLFGVVPWIDANVGFIWAVTTDDIYKYPTTFLRESRIWLDRFQRQYGTLCNHIDARNSVHIRWLKWLGFTFRESEPYGPYGLPFHQFYRTS